MHHSWIRLFLLLAFVCISAPDFAQEARFASAESPHYFAPDDSDAGFNHAQSPSDTVLDALLATDEVKESASELNGMEREELRRLFRVVAVRLATKDEQDFLAQGLGPLTGADCYWFWIIRVRNGHANVILFLNGWAVTILKKQTNGYREIRGDWGSASSAGFGIFEYDGCSYKLVRKKHWENKP